MKIQASFVLIIRPTLRARTNRNQREEEYGIFLLNGASLHSRIITKDKKFPNLFATVKVCKQVE